MVARVGAPPPDVGGVVNGRARGSAWIVPLERVENSGEEKATAASTDIAASRHARMLSNKGVAHLRRPI